MNKKLEIGRREFFKSAAFGIAGAAVPVRAARGEAKAQDAQSTKKTTPKIKEHRLLGRTGFQVSDLATGYIQDFGVFSAMLDAGVNYIDTGESYPGSHKPIGVELKGQDRKKLFITSKMQPEGDITKEGFLKRARKCLEDLETDYFDCMMLHMPERGEVLRAEGFHGAMQELKAEGRVRFLGVSHHGSFWFRDPEETMDRILLAAVEDGGVVFLPLAYH